MKFRPIYLTSISATLLLSLACGAGPSEKPNAKPQTEASHAQLNTPATETVRNTASVAVGSTSVPISGGFTEADFDRHVKELRTRIQTKLSSNQFSIVIQPPFVVVGDEPEPMVRERANDTVKWAVDRLKQDFFTRDPNDILDIWLFKDDESYRKHTRLMFGDVPSTPYGYYSRTHKALIMNIGTGGGTLVHEIVHPFIESNFPACPSWLNEGLGSLYEQCGEVSGRIHGFTNWRLPGLQRAINEERVPSFQTLMEMDSRTFYNDATGVNYAQSRYLCYYLQEKGLLVKFYKEFAAKQPDDPSGFKTLQKVLGETDMEAFKKRWEKYVLGLRQGYSVTIQ